MALGYGISIPSFAVSFKSARPSRSGRSAEADVPLEADVPTGADVPPGRTFRSKRAFRRGQQAFRVRRARFQSNNVISTATVGTASRGAVVCTGAAVGAVVGADVDAGAPMAVRPSLERGASSR